MFDVINIPVLVAPAKSFVLMPGLCARVGRIHMDVPARISDVVRAEEAGQSTDHRRVLQQPCDRRQRLDDMLAGEFGVAHFKLPSFYGAGQFLHGFEDRVMAPWRDALSAHGFTWERCYPIIFVSGRNSATNYHMDYSHVIAWQIHGSKRFCGLVDPAAWTTSQQRVTYNPDSFERPADLTDDDFLCYDMPPGAVLWNALLTPHSVTAADDRVAMSVNISHGGLRLNGELCHFAQELFDDRTARGLRTDNIVV